MPWVGFELTIPVFETAKAFHALDRAAIVIGRFSGYIEIIPLDSINRPVIVMETQCVFCDLGTRVSYIIYMNFRPQWDKNLNPIKGQFMTIGRTELMLHTSHWDDVVDITRRIVSLKL
jgi:hypothetical protein